MESFHASNPIEQERHWRHASHEEISDSQPLIADQHLCPESFHLVYIKFKK